MVQQPELQAGNQKQPVLLDMYDHFISDFEHRINPLSLVEICLHIVRSCSDPAVSVHFLERLKEKVGKHEAQLPLILIRTAQGAIHLQQKNLEEAKVIYFYSSTLSIRIFEN
jgi:26S proteasome regulatory subunit N9